MYLSSLRLSWLRRGLEKRERGKKKVKITKQYSNHMINDLAAMGAQGRAPNPDQEERCCLQRGRDEGWARPSDWREHGKLCLELRA